jgi:hypothetical protein
VLQAAVSVGKSVNASLRQACSQVATEKKRTRGQRRAEASRAHARVVRLRLPAQRQTARVRAQCVAARSAMSPDHQSSASLRHTDTARTTTQDHHRRQFHAACFLFASMSLCVAEW